jgi:hypothetical protein
MLPSIENVHPNAGDQLSDAATAPSPGPGLVASA